MKNLKNSTQPKPTQPNPWVNTTDMDHSEITAYTMHITANSTQITAYSIQTNYKSTIKQFATQ